MTDTKTCPFCYEEIKTTAIKCKHCGERLDGGTAGHADATFVPAVPVTHGGAAATVAAGGAGTKLGAYVLGEVIGTGGMGSVHIAHHERLGSPVAVKLLASNLARDPELIARFEQEARLQANLRHPNIVAVTDFIIDGPTCAFVMELVEGRTLSDVIAESRGPLSLDRCLELFLPVLDAVGHAHEQGIVHRDIKPSNLMVAVIGGKELVKITDFGIAKALGGAKRTATGAKMGTLHYMSPEQCKGSKDVDARSDIYSLGVTLYEMVTGRIPFDHDSEYEMMTAHITESPPLPRATNPDISPALEHCLLRALAKDPSQRFQTAREFREDLFRCKRSVANVRASAASVPPATGGLPQASSVLGFGATPTPHGAPMMAAVAPFVRPSATGAPAKRGPLPGLAIASLVLLIAAFPVATLGRVPYTMFSFFPALVMGYMARSQIKKDATLRGGVLVLVVIVVSWLMTARFAIVGTQYLYILSRL